VRLRHAAGSKRSRPRGRSDNPRASTRNVDWVERFVDLPTLLLLVVANIVSVILGRVLGKRYSARIGGNLALRDGLPLLEPS